MWYYHSCPDGRGTPEGGEIVLLSRSDGDCDANPNGKKSWEKDIRNVSDGMSARAEATPETRDTYRWNANSQIQIISNMGRLSEQFVQVRDRARAGCVTTLREMWGVRRFFLTRAPKPRAQGCTGHAMNFNKLGAECRIDHTAGTTPYPVLSSVYG